MNELGSELCLVESFNPVINEWNTLAELSVRRAYVAIAADEHHIYAVGGWNEQEGSLNTVECYSIDEVYIYTRRYFINLL